MIEWCVTRISGFKKFLETFFEGFEAVMFHVQTFKEIPKDAVKVHVSCTRRQCTAIAVQQYTEQYTKKVVSAHRRSGDVPI